jgi:uncharacterized protein (TIGR02677 family)
MDRPGRLRIFAYVDSEKAELYRSVMLAFMAAKQRFALHLRPDEVVDALVAWGWELTREDVEPALRQLCEWGNLDSSPDTAEVATVEDFYRERRLFQLSREGEVAERALRIYEQDIRQPGELQTAALEEIHDLLRELEGLAGRPAEPVKARKVLDELFRRFEDLTEKAQMFLGGLRRSIDLHGSDEDAFLQYKDRLIGYLERFINELIVASVKIAGAIVRVETLGVDAQLEAAAEREKADRLDAEEVGEELYRRWRERWAGLRHWFHGTPDSPSQAEILRAAARSAIPALLNAVEGMHDRRIRRTDRYADWRTLARWFARVSSDADAHRLYRVAFAMTPARHLRIDAGSLDAMDGRMVAPQLSWLAEPTLRITPRLRAKGRYSRPGRERAVEDRSAARAQLAELAEQESRQLERAQRQLVRGRVRLSELGPLEQPLEQGSFALFLELLAQALAQQSGPDSRVQTSSADGSLLIRLEPTGDGVIATIHAPSGMLSGPNHFLDIQRMDDVLNREAAE